MAVIAETRARAVMLGGHGSLMAQCLVAGLPVASACSGRGACGKCAMRVLEGAAALSAPDEHERLVLARNGAGPEERLGCQCRVRDPRAAVRVTTGYW